MPCLDIVDYGHVEPGSTLGFGATPATTPIGISFLGDTTDTMDSSDSEEHAAVTKLLDRKDHWRDPLAKEAIRTEADDLVKRGTWLLDTVVEKRDLIKRAKASGQKIHLGDLNPICSIKNSEMDSKFHKYKGRITFRGDDVRDEDGSHAVFQ